MDSMQFVDSLRKIPEVVTVANVMNIPISTKLFVFINTQKNLILVEGTVIALNHHTADGLPDILITMEFTINGLPHASTLVLGQTYNGWTDKIGDEGDNLNRVFLTKAAALRYFEDISFVNDIKTLERSRSIHGLISRLLHQANHPRGAGGSPSDRDQKKD